MISAYRTSMALPFLFCSSLFAQDGAAIRDQPDPQGEADFSIDDSATELDLRDDELRFAKEDDVWWSYGASVGFSDESTEYGAQAMVHFFLADNFEFNLTFGGFFHDQEGDDAGSGTFAVGWRWYFENEGDQAWYIDVGVGVLGATDEVPVGGTRFNFTPRAGIGTTIAIFEDSRARLDLGVRWYHFSNASTSGSDENPARDGVQLYIGVMMPF